MAHDANLVEQSSLKRISLPSATIPVVAAVFGAAALAIVVAGLTIPIPGTGVVTDPREIFTTTGAALTGPFGGVVIGILAGIREPGGIELASLLAHIAGGLWMGFSYKKLVREHTQMPLRACCRPSSPCAAQIASALHGARVYDQQLAHESVSRELALARANTEELSSRYPA